MPEGLVATGSSGCAGLRAARGTGSISGLSFSQGGLPLFSHGGCFSGGLESRLELESRPELPA
jgi:hypothetical protein